MRLLKSFVVFCVLIFPNLGNAENSGNKWNFYTGMFDFSDKGKRSNLIGIQHINEDLYRETSFGTLQPVTGAFITADNAKYLYTGFQIPKKMDLLRSHQALLLDFMIREMEKIYDM